MKKIFILSFLHSEILTSFSLRYDSQHQKTNLRQHHGRGKVRRRQY
jgi:hypothetical protein